MRKSIFKVNFVLKIFLENRNLAKIQVDPCMKICAENLENKTVWRQYSVSFSPDNLALNNFESLN